MSRSENQLPAGESQAEWANQIETSEIARGSQRWPDKIAIAYAAVAVGVILAGGVLGGKIIGECGAYAGGLVGLATSLTLAAWFSGFSHRQLPHG